MDLVSLYSGKITIKDAEMGMNSNSTGLNDMHVQLSLDDETHLRIGVVDCLHGVMERAFDGREKSINHCKNFRLIVSNALTERYFWNLRAGIAFLSKVRNIIPFSISCKVFISSVYKIHAKIRG